MSKLLLVLALLSLKTIGIKSGRILATLPTPSLSHQVAFHPVINELVKRGHDVVVVTTDSQYFNTESPENLTEIDLHDTSYKVWRQFLLTDVMGVEEEIIYQMLKVYEALVKVFDVQLNSEELKDIIFKRKGEFDLLITEGVVRPALAFSHVYKVPLIQMNSLGPVTLNDLYIGAFTHPLLFPYPLHKKVYDLTLWDKIKNLYHHYTFKYHFDNYMAELENEVLRKHFGPNIPSVLELVNNIQMLILNVHPLWSDNQPVPPNVIYMNGIHVKQKKELPKDLKAYLDSSQNGTIYMSFGTNVIPSALRADKMNILLDTLSRLPYDILLKWDTEKSPIQAKNIKVSKWLPQADLLRHPKIKLFITQGGLQSLDEAMTAGVPLVAIPLFTDQWYNVEKIYRHKIGIRLNMEDLTEQALRGAIDTVISDKCYRENMVRLNTLMHDQPQPPLERVVWWIEHVLRHGTAIHLRPPTAGLSMAQFIELDLIIIAVVVICATLFIVLYAFYGLYKLISYNNKVKKA